MATRNPVADVATLDTSTGILAFTGVDFAINDVVLYDVDGTEIAIWSSVGLKRQDETAAAGPGGTVDLSNYYTKAQTQGLLDPKADDTDLVVINNRLGNTTAQDPATPVSSLATKADLVGGKVPASQLPSYVDDVLEFAQLSAFPTTGEAGKIYVAQNTGKQYRWSGSGYSLLSDSGLTADQLAALPSGINSGNKLVASNDPRLVAATPYDDSAIRATQTQQGQQLSELDGRVDALEAVQTRDFYDVPTAKRKAVVDADSPAVEETDTTYYGCEFVDEVYGPDQPAYYKCRPSAPAQTGGATVWKWFRSAIL